MKKKKKLMLILGLFFEIILSYLGFITIKNKTSINAMDTLNENYNEINTIKMSECDEVEEGGSLENHYFIYLDDNRYILYSYQVVTPDNIPEKLSKGNEIQTLL